MNAVLHLEALVLDLEIEVLFAENVSILSCSSASSLVVVFHQPFSNFALQTSGKTDQPAGMLGQKLLAHTRLVVEAMKRGLGRNLDQVAVPLFVLGKHQKMVISVALGGSAVIVFLADVEFATDDRLHTLLVGGVHEVNGAKDVAVIRHSNSRHPKLFHVLTKFFNVAGAIQQGIVGVQVQVDELGHGSIGSLNQRSAEEGCGRLCVSGLFIHVEIAVTPLFRLPQLWCGWRVAG